MIDSATASSSIHPATATSTAAIQQMNSIITGEFSSSIDERPMSTVSETINSYITQEPFELTNPVSYSGPDDFGITDASLSNTRSFIHIRSSSLLTDPVAVPQTTDEQRSDSAQTPAFSVTHQPLASRNDNQSTSTKSGIGDVSTNHNTLNQFTASSSDIEVAPFSFSFSTNGSTDSDTIEPVDDTTPPGNHISC